MTTEATPDEEPTSTYTEEELAAAEADLPPIEPDNGVEDTEADEVIDLDPKIEEDEAPLRAGLVDFTGSAT